jgi:Patatin-like phospholipase
VLLSWLRRNVPRFYLLRFPIILALILVALVPLGLVWIPSMFRNLFILPAQGITQVSLFSILGAITVLVTARVTLLYGPQRFGVSWSPRDPHLTFRALLGHVLLAAPLIGVSVWLSGTEGRVGVWVAVLMAAKGVSIAMLFVWLAELLQAWLTSAEVERPDLAVPSRRAISAAHRRPPPEPQRWLRWVLLRFRWLFGPGYLAPNGDLLPGHSFATAFLVVYAAAYIYGYFRWHPGTAAGAEAPALVSLLILATLSIWLFAGLAFYFDRHRVPILFPVLATTMVLWTTSYSDYYFDLVKPTGDWSLLEDPADIARKRQHDLLTVVAVDGGGIQAAAWGARVLTGIQATWPGFHRSVRFISSVSGGSVGTMYFVGALRAEAPPTQKELDDVLAFAKRGSLNEAAWGLAYPDLWRAIVPIPGAFRFEKDRGWAVQQAWERGWKESRGWTTTPNLSEWVRGVHEGWRPSTSFNAVAVENGQRFSFGTFAPPYQWGIDTVSTTFPDFDVPVSTAARLSATFPYVTPIARSRPGPGVPNGWHFADGGYYDNTGMGLAMRWLDRALSAHVDEYKGKAVAFIRVRSSPTQLQLDTEDRGWQYQVVGPVEALMAVRVAAQRERAETELEFLQRLWCLQGVEIRKFEFAFEQSEPGPPLSWQLSQAQQDDIDREWDSRDASRSDRNQAALRDLLALAASPVQACRTTGSAAVR